MTGLAENLVAPRMAQALARKHAARLREYRSVAHYIMTEPGREGPCADTIEWMDRVARG
jgi:hypothetical protein